MSALRDGALAVLTFAAPDPSSFNSLTAPSISAETAPAAWISVFPRLPFQKSLTAPDSSSSAYYLLFMYDFGNPECSDVHRISAYPVRAVRVP